jgi:hypothetical protein
MATLDSIAEEIGYSRNELMQSMVKFGLTNRDWRNEGLTAHKRLPRYEENPMATKPPSPAQLAARARFAEMARSGSLNRKRQIAAKQNAGVKRKTNPTSESYAGEFSMTVNEKTTHRWFAHTSNQWAKSHGFDYELVSNAVKHGAPVKFTKTRAIVAVDEAEDGSPVTEKWEIRNLVFYRKNPAKKTVSQKISQLVHEGYPQRQAVAVALNEQRAGKVKRNPQAKSVKSTSTANFAYCVEAKRSLGSAGSVFEMVAGFNTKTQAQNYVDAILASNPGVTLRIKAYK